VTRELIPQDAALRMQLAAIVGSEPDTSYIELRPLDREGRPVVQRRTFVPVKAHEDVMDRLAALAPMMNVYIGAAPRAHQDGTAAAVERVWTLWADLDGRDAIRRLHDFRPLPAIVIRSGSPDSAHAYWPLRQSLEPSWAQRANRRLALALGGDMAATDPARILRPAGTFNLKHKPAPPVVCTRCELESFTLDDVVGGLPDSDHYKPRHATRPTQSPATCSDRGAALAGLAGLARVIREARPPTANEPGERNVMLNWAAYRAAEHIAAGDYSQEIAESELLAAAFDAGLDEAEARRTFASGLGAGMRTAA
jgi:hypothetical protein